MLQQISLWWNALETRERALLSFLMVFLSVALLYALGWKPLQESQQLAQQKLDNAQQTWQWLNQQVPLIEKLPAHQKQIDNNQAINNQNQLLSLLQQQLRQQNLFKDIKSVKGISNGAEVRFDKVRASRLLSWLANLEQTGVVAHDLKMSYLENDSVKAKVQFKLAE